MVSSRFRVVSVFVTKFLILLIFFGILTTSASHRAGAQVEAALVGNIPPAAQADPLFNMGYLVATYYSGVKKDGTGDSTLGLQDAIDDAYNNKLTLYIPTGTYIISDTLRAYEWVNWNASKGTAGGPNPRNHVIRGQSGASRPVIKLKSGALSKFDNPSSPRPMIAYRLFTADNENAIANAMPAHPLTNPPNFWNGDAMYFDEMLQGVNFDTSDHVGAIGVTFDTAQGCSLLDVKVDATNSYAGFYQLPGRNSITANIEVTGGKYGVIIAKGTGLQLDSVAGAQLTGVTLIGQTVAALNIADSTPSVVVGFKIVKTGPGPAVEAMLPISLIDGTIEMQSSAIGAVAVDNSQYKKNLYLRNVYVKGTTQLVRSASTSTGSGTWIRIKEYVYNDQFNKDGNNNVNVYPSYGADEFRFESRSYINGTLGASAIPVFSTASETPPATLLSRHIWTRLPSFEDGPYVDIRNHGAVAYYSDPGHSDFAGGNKGADSTAEIQAAINAASNNGSGHGRVFIPRGVFYIGSTLTLHANTVLMGAGPHVSAIAFHDSWKPTSEVSLIRTADSKTARTYMGFITLFTRTTPDANDYFGFLHWRAGRNSMTVGLNPHAQWKNPNLPSQAKKALYFSNGGGGRHYASAPLDDWNSANRDFRLLYINGTTEPLAFYGQNSEITKMGTNPVEAWFAATNIEIVDAKDVRIYGVKREGGSPTLIVRNSNNIALYSSGAMSGAGISSLGGFIQIYGNSNNILATNVNPRDVGGLPNGNVILREALAGQPVKAIIPWPNQLSIYKRGEIDDSMFGGGGSPTPPPPPTELTLQAEDMPIKSGGGAADSGEAWNLWSTGNSIAQDIVFPASGTYTLTLRARGTSAAGVWPNAEIRIDGAFWKSVSVNSASYASYPLTGTVSAGTRRVSVVFTNDYYAAPEDRNLVVDWLKIQ